MVTCVLMLGLNTQKLEIKAYYGKNIENETLADFKFYNKKLQKIFLKKGVSFREVSCKDKKGVGYIVVVNGNPHIYKGVYTDVDLLDALTREQNKK